MNKKAFVLSMSLLLAAILITCAGGGGSTAPVTVEKTTGGKVSFKHTVLPILTDHCIRCHGEDRDGDLYILNYEGVMKGGKSGNFVIPGDPDHSRLVTSVEKTKPPYMPPKIFPALTEDRLQAIRQWISEGAENN
jgi:mono/diheme cytochrome c family protein